MTRPKLREVRERSEVGNDGLTDVERAESAERYARGPARPRTPEEIAEVRARARDLFKPKTEG